MLKLRKSLLILAIALFGSTLVGTMPAGASPGPRSATGVGCTTAFSYAFRGITIRVPGTCLHHSIHGSGRTVRQDTSFFAVSGGFPRACNWRIDYDYYNTSNVRYRHYVGPVHTGCNSIGSRTIYPGTLPSYGRGCARLYINGILKVSQCHYITS